MTKKLFFFSLLLMILLSPLTAQSVGGRGSGSGSTSPPVVLHKVTVNANVNGCDVYINGSKNGMTPMSVMLPPGNYTIRVAKRGYNDWIQTVNVNGDMTINANLAAPTFNLTVTTNVPAAEIFVNGANQGRGRLNQALAPGNYQVRVAAPGYSDFTATVNLNQNQTVNAVLQPAMGTLNLIIPAEILDRREGNPSAQIKLHVDGSPQNSTSLQLTPGRHVIRVSSGGLSFERMVDITAGQAYNLEVFMGFTVNGN